MLMRDLLTEGRVIKLESGMRVLKNPTAQQIAKMRADQEKQNGETDLRATMLRSAGDLFVWWAFSADHPTIAAELGFPKRDSLNLHLWPDKVVTWSPTPDDLMMIRCHYSLTEAYGGEDFPVFDYSKTPPVECPTLDQLQNSRRW